MEFFILLPGDDKKSTEFNSNKLGEADNLYGSFWPDQGFDALQNIINNNPELSEKITIVNSNGKEYTINEFLNLINRYEIKN